MQEGGHQARLAVGPLALEGSLKCGDTRHDMRAGLIEQLGRFSFDERFEQVESTQVGGCRCGRDTRPTRQRGVLSAIRSHPLLARRASFGIQPTEELTAQPVGDIALPMQKSRRLLDHRQPQRECLFVTTKIVEALPQSFLPLRQHISVRRAD